MTRLTTVSIVLVLLGPLPLSGVRVTAESAGPVAEAVTGGDGRFTLPVGGGSSITVVEHDPSGFVSLSPDTLGPFAVGAGDTVPVEFADVPPVYLSVGTVAQGVGGSYVDFPHVIEAGMAGHVDLLAVNDTGADSLQNVILLDPVSGFVDPVVDAFGPGQGVEWRPLGGPPVYFKMDDTDGDECDWSAPERLIRLVLSRNSPFCVAPGQSGSFSYMVRVR
jgi:hypothetical protein